MRENEWDLWHSEDLNHFKTLKQQSFFFPHSDKRLEREPVCEQHQNAGNVIILSCRHSHAVLSPSQCIGLDVFAFTSMF